jgi:hypothetical protein
MSRNPTIAYINVYDIKIGLASNHLEVLMAFAVLYAVVRETDEDGVFCDFPYFGGIVDTQADAAQLSKDITNDRGVGGTVVTKFYEYFNDFGAVNKLAYKHFQQIANDMYDVEDLLDKKKK